MIVRPRTERGSRYTDENRRQEIEYRTLILAITFLATKISLVKARLLLLVQESGFAKLQKEST